MTDALNRSMANTVVHNVGLFVSVFDLLRVGDSFLLHDGCSHTPVTFRALVFRPFVEEVLVGRIKSCSKQVRHVMFAEPFVTCSRLRTYTYTSITFI